MQENSHPFVFKGKSGEFFKIWIVNIMLSIITLGIYSAWAKVRNRRYFYSNTLLMNMPFDYLADPIKILKGRLLAFALFMIYILSSMLSPLLQSVIMLGFLPLLPWIIIKAIKFNLYNSAYRNIRFHFDANYLKALWVFIGLPILVALSLGLAFPYFTKQRKKFVIDNSAFGTSQFELSITMGQVYSIFLKTIGIFLLIFLLLATLLWWQILGGNIPTFSLDSPVNLGITGMIIPLSFMLFYIIGYWYWYTNITNLVFNHTTLQQCQFESRLKTTTMCWLYFSNIVAIIFTFGLLIPWAMIRTANYRISSLSIITDTDLDFFIADEAEKASAISEELGGILDIDISL